MARKPRIKAGRADGLLTIASWNVNSVRLRFDALARIAAEHAPDVLCLQEIKVADDLFPRDVFRDLGYPHLAIAGQPGYHGVAVAARKPFAAVERRDWCGKGDRRHLAVRLANGLTVQNFYVPAGGDIPDPKLNDKFAHKLQFVAEMAAWFARNAARDGRTVLVGDLNIAPLETDVWSHRQLLKVVSHTPVEVAALAQVQQSRDWVDAVRHFIPPEQKLYTWWSYRAADWEASDRGRRLDHVWVTPDLKPALRAARVIREARGFATPSDHVPVLVTLKP